MAIPSLTLDLIMSLNTESKAFWDRSDVEGELKRVFDICNGCHRCYNLCPSFNDLFERLDRDEVDGEGEKLNFSCATFARASQISPYPTALWPDCKFSRGPERNRFTRYRSWSWFYGLAEDGKL